MNISSIRSLASFNFLEVSSSLSNLLNKKVISIAVAIFSFIALAYWLGLKCDFIATSKDAKKDEKKEPPVESLKSPESEPKEAEKEVPEQIESEKKESKSESFVNSDNDKTTVRTTLNTSVEALAQDAYRTFEQNKKLKFYVNRAHSNSDESVLIVDMYRPKSDSDEDIPLMLDDDLRERLLASVILPIEPSLCTLYYTSLDGTKCYINQAVVDRFTEIAKKNFPELSFFKRGGVIDKATNTELLPIKKQGPQSFASMSDFFVLKTSAWVAKPN